MAPRAERNLREAQERVVVLRRQLAKEHHLAQVAVKSVILVEGESDRIAGLERALRTPKTFALGGVGGRPPVR